jgi:hypothetical protein
MIECSQFENKNGKYYLEYTHRPKAYRRITIYKFDATQPNYGKVICFEETVRFKSYFGMVSTSVKDMRFELTYEEALLIMSEEI